MNIFRYLFTTSRPSSWPLFLGPFLIGAIAAKPPLERLWEPPFLAFWLFFTLPAGLWFYGLDEVAGYRRRRTDKLIWAIVPWLPIPWLAYTYTLSDSRIIAVLSAFLSLTILYTIPPARLRDRSVLDLFGTALYIIPGVLGYFLAGGEVLDTTLLFAAWCWTIATRLFLDAPEETRGTSKQIGLQRCLTLSLFLYIAATFLSYSALGFQALLLGLLYITLTLSALSVSRPGLHHKRGLPVRDRVGEIANQLRPLTLLAGFSLLLAII